MFAQNVIQNNLFSCIYSEYQWPPMSNITQCYSNPIYWKDTTWAGWRCPMDGWIHSSEGAGTARLVLNSATLLSFQTRARGESDGSRSFLTGTVSPSCCCSELNNIRFADELSGIRLASCTGLDEEGCRERKSQAGSTCGERGTSRESLQEQNRQVIT